jgi:hypothetical protein
MPLLGQAPLAALRVQEEKEDQQQHQRQGDDDDSTVISVQVEVLEGDLLADILSYLHWAEVMKSGAVCRVWRNALPITPVQELFVTKREIALFDLRRFAKPVQAQVSSRHSRRRRTVLACG